MKTFRIPETLYESIFDNAFNGFAYCQMLFDEQGCPVDFIYLRVNKNFTKLMALQNVVGKKATELISGAAISSPEVIKIYGRVSLKGKPENFKIYIKTVSKWFLVSVYSPRKNFFVAAFQNITDSKQIEKDLENARMASQNVLEDLQLEKVILAGAKAKDEAMLASIGDGVIIIDPVGKVTFMNQSAQNLLGYKSKEIIGKLLYDVVLAEDEKGIRVEAEERPMMTALGTGARLKGGKKHTSYNIKTTHGIYYYVRKNKTKFPVSIAIAPVVLDNKIVGAIEVFRDITQEKEIDKAKSEFVSLASHQLKTPPTAIKLLTERILNKKTGKLTPKQREYFEDIRSTNQRMIDLINALLNVSRIDLGAFNMQLEKKDIGAIVQDVFYELKPTLGKKEIRLEEKYQKKSTVMPVDESMFRIVINNLAMNAINYTSKGGRIIIEYKEMHKGQVFGKKHLKENCFTVSITDTGYGIPKTEQSNIFTKFFRADNARGKHPDGTGLGLYVVKSILDNSGGSVRFFSEENKGTVFYITVPMTGMGVKTK